MDQSKRFFLLLVFVALAMLVAAAPEREVVAVEYLPEAVVFDELTAAPGQTVVTCFGSLTAGTGQYAACVDWHFDGAWATRDEGNKPHYVDAPWPYVPGVDCALAVGSGTKSGPPFRPCGVDI